MRKLLCWLNWHRWIIPAWSAQLRFCPHCMEWERQMGNAWTRMSLEDFQDFAKNGEFTDGR